MRILSLALCTLLLLSACGGEAVKPEPEPEPTSATPAERVTVDHILVAVKGARIPDGMEPEAAKELAYDLLKQLEAGADWAALKTKHSADPPPGGPYAMFDDVARVPQIGEEIPRSMMAPAFGDVGFSLKVGELGMADFDPRTSPFGFHIIKRVK